MLPGISKQRASAKETDAEPAPAPSDEAAAPGESSANEQTAADGVLTLTERVRPALLFTAEHSESEAARVLTIRVSRGARSGQREDMTNPDVADGLYVELPPPTSQRSQQLFGARLEAPFFGGKEKDPPSKAICPETGALLRQPDPVRHVRLRMPSVLAELQSHTKPSNLETARPSPVLWGSLESSLVEGARESEHVLHVSIGALQLHDHPLFLAENALQSTLRALAAQLSDARERQLLQLHAHKIAELNLAIGALREQIAAREASGEASGAAAASDGASTTGGGSGAGAGGALDLSDLRRRLAMQLVECLQTRQLKDEQECSERLLVRRMLQLWQRIKAERNAQGFRASRVKLQVQLRPQLLAQDEADLEEDREEEAAELALLAELQAELEATPLRSYALAQGAHSRDAALAHVSQRQRELRRKAGEDELVPLYTETTEPTGKHRLDDQELGRQERAARQQYYCVLLLDAKVVGATAAAPLHPHDFCVRLDTSMQLQLMQAPQAMSLQLWQRRYAGLADKMLAEVFVAVPGVASPPLPHWQQYSFTARRNFKAEHDTSAARLGDRAASLGEGEPPPLREVTPVEQRCLRGQIELAVAWTTKPAQSKRQMEAAAEGALLPGNKRSRLVNFANGALDPNLVKLHVLPETLDPNAPQDAPLLSIISRAERSGAAGAFRLKQLLRELLWSERWVQSDRTKLLELRGQKPDEWSTLLKELPEGERVVAATDAQINPRMRELLKPRVEHSEPPQEEGDRGPQQGSKVRNWLAKMLTRHERAQKKRQYRMQTDDYVREPMLEVEPAEVNCNAFLKIFESRRKLNPRRRARQPEAGSAEVARFVEIVVQAGIDMPVRAAEKGAARQPRLVVECSFQGHKETTDVKAGANPTWNQILNLPMHAPEDDWSQGALSRLADAIVFNVYDLQRRSRVDSRDPSIRTTREEPYLLGSFSIPFSTLYREGKLEGLFPLTMPPVLLGYEKEESALTQEVSATLVPASAIKLFMTVNPLLPPFKEERQKERATKADRQMQEFAAVWIKSVRSKLPRASCDRYLRVFAPALDGEKTLLCRYVRPQPPPRELAGSEKLLLRFVSLVPFLEDATLGSGTRLDIWNTSESFLELCAGDEEEHALLLCNFFLSMRREAYVVLGHGIPEGETCYVLTKSLQREDCQLWNAHTGRVYTLDDTSCPLTSVGCVFNDKNIWANIQKSAEPQLVNWELFDPKLWRPFFSRKGGYPEPQYATSVQVAQLRYRRTAEEYRLNVEREVEERLQRQFEDRRAQAHRPTDWNHSVAAKLKLLLRRFEEDASGVKTLTQVEHDAVLERVRASYRVVGMPINMSYTELAPLVERLEATNIFSADSPHMQFVLTTYVHAYTNQICSVWVYVASLEDLRKGDRASLR